MRANLGSFQLGTTIGRVESSTYTNRGNCGVYRVMKGKLVIGVCALLTVAAVLVLRWTGGTRAASPANKSQLVVMPDGTIAGPRNDNMSIVYKRPRPSTNAPWTNAPAANK